VDYPLDGDTKPAVSETIKELIPHAPRRPPPRQLREAKGLSQGDIEERSGLKRSYVSRVEGGHTVPAVDTLAKLARALEVPLYQLFYEGEEPPKLPHLRERKTATEISWGSTGKQARFIDKLRQLLGRIDKSDRQLLLRMAQKMARR